MAKSVLSFVGLLLAASILIPATIRLLDYSDDLITPRCEVVGNRYTATISPNPMRTVPVDPNAPPVALLNVHLGQLAEPESGDPPIGTTWDLWEPLDRDGYGGLPLSLSSVCTPDLTTTVHLRELEGELFLPFVLEDGLGLKLRFRNLPHSQFVNVLGQEIPKLDEEYVSNYVEIVYRDGSANLPGLTGPVLTTLLVLVPMLGILAIFVFVFVWVGIDKMPGSNLLKGAIRRRRRSR